MPTLQQIRLCASAIVLSFTGAFLGGCESSPNDDEAVSEEGVIVVVPLTADCNTDIPTDDGSGTFLGELELRGTTFRARLTNPGHMPEARDRHESNVNITRISPSGKRETWKSGKNTVDGRWHELPVKWASSPRFVRGTVLEVEFIFDVGWAADPRCKPLKPIVV